MSDTSTAASRIDSQVGERIRRRRILLGYTQDQLGEALGISYQQIQKYETGANRVSAGRLFQIAETLQTSVAWFFEGLSAGAADGMDEEDTASSRNVIDLVRNFSRIEDERIRSAVLSLVRSLGDKEDAVRDQDPVQANGHGADQVRLD